jgi:hypothetical protein
MPVRVFQRHTGLPRPTEATQRHHPRPIRVGPGKPGIQASEQLPPPGQERWPRQQPHGPARQRGAARPGQRHHLIGQLGEHPFEALALQVGHVMVQPASGASGPPRDPAEHDLPHQVTSQRLG